MADPRTFVLIGDFQDNITPALESINNTINRFKSNMASMSSRRGGGFNDVTQSVGKLISAQKHLATSIKEVGDAAKTATSELKEYRQALGKISSAHYHIAKSSQQAGDKVAKGWTNATEAALDHKRKTRKMGSLPSGTLNASGRRAPSRSGGAMPMDMPSRRGGGGGGGDDIFPMARFTLAFSLSEAIAQPITNAITTGFQIGTDMMIKPFQYFAGALRERMSDEMSDLKTASAYMQINREAKTKFLQGGDFQSAIDFAQSSNLMMDKLAASLPGTTQDYIEVQKRISDSLAAVVANDPAGAMKLAEKYRQEAIQEGTPGMKDLLTPLTGEVTTKKLGDTLQTLQGKLTTQTVLAGMGAGSGQQGSMGSYGLPALTERMLSQDVSMGQLRRYAAIFRDPMIMRNLEKELPKISQTAVNTADRTEAVANFFEKVLPPELVARYRRTLMGVQETFNTAIFSPESGIFGIGRRLKNITGKFDEFGRMLDAEGNVVDDITQQARIDMGLYDLFRDVLANLGRILAPVVENLSRFWDPLQSVGKLLDKARVATMKVLASFEVYLKSYGEYAKGLSKVGQQAFSESGGKELRATFATIANLFRSLGVISSSDFEGIMDQLANVNMDGGKIFKDLLDKFLNSEVARQIGDFIGTLIGTVLSEVAQVTGFISGRIAGSGKLFQGLGQGFNAAGGPAALRNIFSDIFKSMFKVIGEALKILPFEAYFMGAAMLLLPVAVQTLAMLIAHRIADGIFDMGKSKALQGAIGAGMSGAGKRGAGGALGNMFITARGAQAASGLRGRAGAAGGRAKKYLTEPVTQGTRRIQNAQFPVALGMEKTPYTRAQQIQRGAQGLAGLPGKLGKRVGAAPIAPVLQALMGGGKGGGIGGKLAKGMGKVGKFVPGGALAFGAIDAGMRMAQGEDAGKAIGGAAASTIGATLGGILGQALIPIPGVGAALGTVAGGFLGDRVFNALMPASKEQLEAASIQKQAALQQAQAAGVAKSGVDVNAAGGQFNFGSAQELTQRLNQLGLSADVATRSFQSLYRIDQEKQLKAQTAADALNAEIQRLKALGRPNEEIANTVRGLQTTYDTARNEAQASLTALNAQWAKIGPESSAVILNSFKNMPVGQVEAAIAEKIRQARVVAHLTRGNDRKPPTPGDGVAGAAFGSPGKNFSSLAKAVNFENKHKPPGSKIVIANSSEHIIPTASNGYIPSTGMMSHGGMGGYGEVTVNAPITINGAGANSEEIAYAVAQKLSEAVVTARASALFSA